MVSEIARSVMKARGFTRMDVARLEMQEAILEAILKKHGEESIEVPMIHDRSALDPVVYAVLTAEDAKEATQRKGHLVDTKKFNSILERYRQSTVILLKPVREWIMDDGIRSLEDLDKCYEIFRLLLSEYRIPFREIGTEMRFLEERVAWLTGVCLVG